MPTTAASEKPIASSSNYIVERRAAVAEVESKHENQKVDQGAPAIELWRHFAGTGASDKNTMVTVASWLLAFSATIIGYIVTQLFKGDSFDFIQPWKAFSLAVLGAVISFVAGYVVLLYAGYANRNWARADDIALKCGWGELLPDNSKAGQEPDKAFGLPRFAVGWSKDSDPQRQLAPVFWLFAWLSLFVLIVHLIFFIKSLCQILSRPVTS